MKECLAEWTGCFRPIYDATDYVGDLIRRDQERTSRIATMQRLVDEGLVSGVSDETMDDILLSLHEAAE
jgi:antitoxin ParD1/3/4